LLKKSEIRVKNSGLPKMKGNMQGSANKKQIWR
jgi:hypothetical protein